MKPAGCPVNFETGFWMGVGADALDVWLWRFHQAKGSVQLIIQHKHIQTSTLLEKGRFYVCVLGGRGGCGGRGGWCGVGCGQSTELQEERKRVTKRMKTWYLCIPVSTESASLFTSLSITNPITRVLKFCSPNVAYLFSVDDTSESIVLVSKDHLFRLVFTCRSTQFDGSSSQVS